MVRLIGLLFVSGQAEVFCSKNGFKLKSVLHKKQSKYRKANYWTTGRVV